VAVLRVTYDLVDRLKTWEEERGLDCTVAFRRICASLDAEYVALGLVRDRTGGTVTAPGYAPRDVNPHDVMHKRLTHLRARNDSLAAERGASAKEVTRLAESLASLAAQRDETLQVLQAERKRAEEAEAACVLVQNGSAANRQRAEQAESEYAAEQRRAEQAEAAHMRAESEAAAQRELAERAEAAHMRAESEAAAQRERAEQADATRERIRLELQQRMERVEAEYAQLWAECGSERQCAERAEQALDDLRHEHHLLEGSFRTFLRGYLPRLRRHLLGQRP
jgi:chemosensory pili system protein ChpA (sensor histidine kinase/response regulator)